MSHTEGLIKIVSITPYQKGAIIVYKEAGKTWQVYGELEDEASLAVGDDNFINIFYIIDPTKVQELK